MKGFVKFANAQVEDPSLRGSGMVSCLAGSYQVLERYTRTADGEVFSLKTMNEQVKEGDSYVYDGVSLQRTDTNQWTLRTYTLDAGRHVLSFKAKVDQDGALVEDMLVNAFGLGMMRMRDQDCVTEHLQLLLEKDQETYWDRRE